jgi:predicted ATP-grasp superfamily ATP-dependent carboligase
VRVFIYEYTCSVADKGRAQTESLRVEGLAMLSAILDDFVRVPGVEAVTLLDEGCAGRLAANLPRRTHTGEERSPFLELACWADYSLIIAPECEGLLETRCRWVLEDGGQLLGPGPEAVRLAGDKLALGVHLRQHGVPTPAAFPHAAGAAAVTFPLVVKPRHGAGSLATFLVRTPGELPSCLARARAECPADEILLQEFAPGRPVSVAFLIGPRQRVPLVPAEQLLSNDGRFHYLGGRLPLAADLAERAVSLAARALAAVPGLNGYVGVDLVLGDAADGRVDQVIEINPRLTTSYVGLRALARFNLAEAMLQAARGNEIPKLLWHPGTVGFRADGSLFV